jgi:hypothetical protein
MNYDTLFQTIQTYTENIFPNTYAVDTAGDQQSVDAKSQIDQFIQQAEQRVYNTVQFPSLRKNVYGVLTANNKYLSCPTDFLSVYSLAVITDVTGDDLDTGTYEFLLNKDVNFIRAAYPTPNDTGVPRHYAIFGPTTTDAVPPAVTDELSLIVGPTPDDGYNVELHYYYYPESITTASSGRSWLGDNFDSVLLYGSLVEAYTFMKGEQDIIALYETKYKEALGMAKRLGDGMERQDAYRSGQYRQKVT